MADQEETDANQQGERRQAGRPPEPPTGYGQVGGQPFSDPSRDRQPFGDPDQRGGQPFGSPGQGGRQSFRGPGPEDDRGRQPGSGYDPLGDPYNRGQRPPQLSGLWRGLWFAAGVLFALFGVLAALLFNMSRPTEVRNEAVKLAAWGMVAGLALELVMLYLMGGPEAIGSLFGFSNPSSAGSGSVF